MIKKLRYKFIMINMLSVCSVLLSVFVFICIFSYHRQQRETLDLLTRTINEAGRPGPAKLHIGKPGPMTGFNPFPRFSVSLSADGQIENRYNDTVEIEEDILLDAVASAYESVDNSGKLISLNLYYLKKASASGYIIAFVDIRQQTQSFQNLILTLLCVGSFALCAFFLISVLLARWSVRPVEKALEQQRQFIADASHELKTPLTVILANTGIILNHKNEAVASQQKWIHFIKEEAERMKKLVEDMLFLAKNDSARLGCVMSDINLSDIVWSALLPFESIAFEHHLHLESDIPPNLTMKGDPAQLQQLVVILLDNACKYTDAEGSISLRLIPQQEKIKLCIHNSGSFITEEQQGHLFERFYRTDESRTREEGGCGLGLSIAKTIVDAHHGKFHVKSSEKKGTSFEVSFERNDNY